MKQTLLGVSVIILLLFEAATALFGWQATDAGMDVSYSDLDLIIGGANRKVFGVLAYVYPIILIYCSWLTYKRFRDFAEGERFDLAFVSHGLGGAMLFFSCLLALAFVDVFAFGGKTNLGGWFAFSAIEGLDALLGDSPNCWIYWLIIVVGLFYISFFLTFDVWFHDKIREWFVDRGASVSNLNNSNLKSGALSAPKPKPAPKPKKIKSNSNLKSEEISEDNSNLNNESVEASEEISNLNAEDGDSNLNETISAEPKITASGVEILSELSENKELLNQLEKGKVEKPKDFVLPSLSYLKEPPKRKKNVNEAEIDQKIANLLEKLRKFRIEGDVVRTYSGPVVTTFEFKPAADVKVSKILNLQDDLAMALRAQTIRIQAPIPGKDVVGIEIPNEETEIIYLREILESDIYKNAKSELTIALGKDIVGAPFVTDLKKLPHLLIAGTTGSGKSVGINAMILSLLYRNSPQTLRFIMIDPKMLEFSMYNDIPHLLAPVVTSPKQAAAVLENTVAEMERRYKIMAQNRVKTIDGYNEKIKKEGGEIFPFIVVIIDEFADLMMTSGKEVEISVARLAQKSRACGIHLIVATQRPSRDVFTGLIKANFPSRIAYRVGQRIDSTIILDQMGAESLLGRGDMLFTPPGSPGLVRLHAPFASEGEIEQIVDFLKDQQEVIYDESFTKAQGDGGAGEGEIVGEKDELYDEALRVVREERKTSISYIQRRLGIGYNRAANIIEQLQNSGVLGEPNAKGQREILI